MTVLILWIFHTLVITSDDHQLLFNAHTSHIVDCLRVGSIDWLCVINLYPPTIFTAFVVQKYGCRRFTPPRAWRGRLFCRKRSQLPSSVIWFHRCQVYPVFQLSTWSHRGISGFWILKVWPFFFSFLVDQSLNQSLVYLNSWQTATIEYHTQHKTWDN